MQSQDMQTPPVTEIPVREIDDNRSFGETLGDSFGDAVSMIATAIPRVIGFLLIVAIGWFVASLLARGVSGVLRVIRFDEIVERSGIAGFMRRMANGADPGAIVAGLVKWLVRIVVLLVAFDILGLPAVSDVLRQLLLWLPNLIVAIAVLFIAGILARALANIVRAATEEAGFTNPDTLANVARTGVWVFGIVVAINQLGIAATLINTLFMGFVGALALAAGLAFGLGGRERAQQALQNWSDAAREQKPRVQRAAKAATAGSTARASDDSPRSAPSSPGREL